MHKLIRHILLAALVASAVTAEAETATAKIPSACSLLTLDDAKTLIGAGAKLDSWSKDDYCSYTEQGSTGNSDVTLSVSRGSNKRWEDTKASGEKIAGLGDEGYFEKMVADWIDVLAIRKDDLILTLTVRNRASPRDAVKMKEVALAPVVVSRLSAPPK
jgi:hypothetical protein